MTAQPQSEARTRGFARVLGPYLVIAALAALVRASDMPTLLAEFEASVVWSWVTGAFVLLSGLIVIALHQYWRGAAAIVVSVLGWLTTLKGLFLLVIPQRYLSFGDSVINAKGWWLAIMAVMALVGLYLTYVGWNPAVRQPKTADRKSGGHLPRAA
ncbi:hypothetical protein [Mycolicibacterium nivoides]|uniref:Integral membrane protein n=1 Tax=Mycolicibacterium nivoides TaxID=2487344 RepID=A0ABW9LB09_9MYCO